MLLNVQQELFVSKKVQKWSGEETMFEYIFYEESKS